MTLSIFSKFSITPDISHVSSKHKNTKTLCDAGDLKAAWYVYFTCTERCGNYLEH